MDKVRCQCTPTCRFGTAPGEPYLLNHDPRPEKAEERRAANAKAGRVGGLTTRPQVPMTAHRTVADIQRLVDQVINEVRNGRGEVLPRAGALEKLAKLALELIKVGALEKENQALRDALATARPDLARSLLRSA